MKHPLVMTLYIFARGLVSLMTAGGVPDSEDEVAGSSSEVRVVARVLMGHWSELGRRLAHPPSVRAGTNLCRC